jgi:hypothetical protein
MPLRRPVTLALVVLAGALVPAAPALAGAFPGEVVDGPSTDLVRVGGVDISRDGTGGVAYVKRDGGVDHIFVSRLVDGAWQAPERVDTTVADPGSQPVVAAGEGGRLAVAWAGGGTLYAAVRASVNGPFGAPQPIASPAVNPSVDIGVNGGGWLVWSSGGVVHAARLDRGTTQFTALADPVNVDPAQAAGDTAAKAPVVATSADETGLVAWGEAGGDGRTHVYARRLLTGGLSQLPQDLTLDSYQGATGGGADQPDVGIEDDSSFAWVVFRQAFADGAVQRTRAIARRLRGSAFDPPVDVDGLAFPGAGEGAGTPRIAINARGLGLAASGRTDSLSAFGAPLENDVFEPASRLETAQNGIAPRPQPAAAENNNVIVAWLQGTAGAVSSPPAVGALLSPAVQSPSPDAQIRGRAFDEGNPAAARADVGPELLLSNPALGPIDDTAGMSVAADRVGDFAIVAMQGTGPDRRLTAAMLDRAPVAFAALTTERFRNLALPPLHWDKALDLWGAPTYTVLVDGQPVGQTKELTLTPTTPVADGVHRWKVVATDRRGQTTQTATRLLRVDATPPQLSFTITGTRRVGKLVTVAASVTDGAAGSGVKIVRIDFGDGFRFGLRRASHVYGRARSYTVRVSATDAAGNAVAQTQVVKIAKPPKPKKHHKGKKH